MNKPNNIEKGQAVAVGSSGWLGSVNFNTMKITLQIELEYDEGMHGDDESVREWWINGVLCAHEDLVLHSNDIGEPVGTITAVRVVPNNKDDQRT